MKTAKTISEQIQLLKSRHLVFNDESYAERFLSRNNYYRLSGYWRKYQINPDAGDNNFVDGTTFEKIIAIYERDARLRNILQKGIGVFEICFRSKFAYQIATSDIQGQQTYLQQNSYDDKHTQIGKPDDLLEHIQQELDRSSEKYIQHYKNIGEPIPIWAAIEILSFGTVSKMYSRWQDKGVVKRTVQDYKTLRNYSNAKRIIHSLVYLRNLCAHQARIWNRVAVVEAPNKDILQRFGNSQSRSIWRTISYLMLLLDEINQNSSFSKNVSCLCKQNEDFYDGLISPTL
jgi:abortive infection bacteriophage resistance protein